MKNRVIEFKVEELDNGLIFNFNNKKVLKTIIERGESGRPTTPFELLIIEIMGLMINKDYKIVPCEEGTDDKEGC